MQNSIKFLSLFLLRKLKIKKGLLSKSSLKKGFLVNPATSGD